MKFILARSPNVSGGSNLSDKYLLKQGPMIQNYSSIIYFPKISCLELIAQKHSLSTIKNKLSDILNSSGPPKYGNFWCMYHRVRA